MRDAIRVRLEVMIAELVWCALKHVDPGNADAERPREEAQQQVIASWS
jgi:hypothetical protein